MSSDSEEGRSGPGGNETSSAGIPAAGEKHPNDEEDNQQEFKKLRAELAQAKAELAQANATKAEAAKLTALLNGTYYTLFTDLWKPTPQGFSEKDMNTFQRTKTPNFVAKGKESKSKTRPYVTTLQHAYANDTSVKDDQNSARTSHNSKQEKAEIWPCDVLENDWEPPSEESPRSNTNINNETKDELTSDFDAKIGELRKEFDPNPDFKAPDAEHPNYSEEDMHTSTKGVTDVVGQIAHLVPASPLYASLYLNVAKWAFGEDNNDHHAIQKMIHGCRKKSQSGEKSNSKRVPSTGLKHFAANKIRLSGQKQFFDDRGNVLIIPILDVQDVLNWNGNGYEALFLVGDKKRAKATVAGVRMLDEGPTAEESEIDTGRELLEKAIRSLAVSLQQLHNNSSNVFKQSHKKVIDDLWKDHNNGMKTRLIDDGLKGESKDQQTLVPTAKRQPTIETATSGSKPAENKNVRVRKVRFVGQSENGHPAPDPLLLVVKAAINWSKFYEITLLVSGEPEEEEDELSLLAEQEFLEMRNFLRKEKMEQDIIGMTVGGET